MVLMAACLVLSTVAASASVRPQAVAGAFYPADADVLRRQVEGFLTAARPGADAPIAVIAPHAGYVFSGATAGRAMAGLRGAAVTRVILLGPSHRYGFAGGALPGATVGAFETPLGRIDLDAEALSVLRGDPAFAGPAEAHGPEHSLEVELPFLQVVAPGAKVVPVLVGVETDLGTATAMARALAPLLGPGTVVVASSDFTHHGPSYRWSPFPVDAALPQRLEGLARATAGRAAAVDPRGFWAQVATSGDTVCGARPIAVLLELLTHAAEATGEVVDVTTSAEAGGDLRQLVTYAGVLFRGSWRGWRTDAEAAAGPVGPERGQALVALARATLETHLRHDASLAEWFAENLVDRAAAGTLGGLRHDQQHRRPGARPGSLARLHRFDRAPRAAGRRGHPRGGVGGPRSALRGPGGGRARRGVELEVSVLCPLAGVCRARRRSGSAPTECILRRGSRSAVFLPQVATEQGWDLETTLSHLARKAGLPTDGWRRCELRGLHRPGLPTRGSAVRLSRRELAALLGLAALVAGSGSRPRPRNLGCVGLGRRPWPGRSRREGGPPLGGRGHRAQRPVPTTAPGHGASGLGPRHRRSQAELPRRPRPVAAPRDRRGAGRPGGRGGRGPRADHRLRALRAASWSGRGSRSVAEGGPYLCYGIDNDYDAEPSTLGRDRLVLRAAGVEPRAPPWSRSAWSRTTTSPGISAACSRTGTA